MSFLPDWNSVESTSRWSDILFWAGIICLVLLAATEVASHVYGNRSGFLSGEAARHAEDQRKHDEDAAEARRKAEVSILQRRLEETSKQVADDHSVKARLRSLFASIDPQILRAVDSGNTDLLIRMQPSDIEGLKSLIAEAGADKLIEITGYGGTMRNSIIMNGSLGP